MSAASLPASVEALSLQSTAQKSQFAGCFPTLNPIDIYRQHIAEELSKVSGIDAQKIYPRIAWTSTLDKGDLSLPVASLQVKQNPVELAKDLVSKFPASDLIHPPTQLGPHIQFFCKPQPLTGNVLGRILKEKAAYGTNGNQGQKDPSDPSKGQKKIIIEFSSPNIAKPFHAGHLRSTIIGGFLANIYTVMGWKVTKMNYLGDWGKQYGLLANGFKEFGSDEALIKDPINHLFDVYVKINRHVSEQDGPIKELKEQIKAKKEKNEDVAELEAQLAKLVDVSEDEKARRYFKSMEDGNPDALALWRKFRDLSIEKYKQTYARLNIDFDVYSGESQIKSESMTDAYKLMEKAGVSEESEGAVIVDFTKHGAKKLGKAIIVRKDGTPLYLTRDIGAITERDNEYHFDKMIYVVAAQQDLHLAQLFKVTELMGHKDLASRCQHINFGMVRGMSTRKGTVKFLDDILHDVGDKMHEVMKKNEVKYAQVEDPVKTADILGITSVMVQDMTGKRINGYEFNLDAMTSFEGDTGPYLQYAHARLCSMTRKSELDVDELVNANFDLLTEQHAVDLVRLLAQWPDVLLQTAKTLEPITVLSYLFRMTHMLSSSYDVLKVIGSEPDVKQARMALYASARQVLNNGMRVLGLSPVQRMGDPSTLIASTTPDLEWNDSGHFLMNETVRNFSWQGLTVTVKDRETKKSRDLINDISGDVKHGELVALMGPSGCGKTTLLNVLARRAASAGAKVLGENYVNDTQMDSRDFQRVTSYVEQEDVLIGSLTVQETLKFAADLSLPSSVSKRQRMDRIRTLLEAFGIQNQANTLVGTPIRKGISGGQKRRVSVASQLITNPRILFLDEPTSGLDSTASFEVMSYAKELARANNLLIIASIHQPSTTTFNLFDKLLLLSAGKTCYFGAISAVESYFSGIGYPIPMQTNPAEFLLDTVSSDFASSKDFEEDRVEAIQTAWANSNEAKSLSRQVSERVSSAEKLANKGFMEEKTRPGTISITTALLHRSFVKSYRDVIAYGIRIAMYLGLAIMMGTVWLRLRPSQDYIQPFINAIFFGSAFMSFMAVAYVPAFLEDRATFTKERANGLYGVTPFIVSNFLIGLPYLFLISILFSIVSYWLSNFQPTAKAFFTWVMWIFLDLVAAESLVVLVTSIFPNFVISLALVAFANGLWMSVGGFLITQKILNPFWKYVFHYIDYQCLIRGTGVLESYGYSTGQTGKWVGILLGIIVGYRVLGWIALYLRRN
ncbi:Aminoacyl-tRNA synthetase, class 1a, anticodon-binding [Penicillium expansum]|uniref:arginine--tRNA ligase n=1 Tax=Penicillium expansum TaxID=27334 RepID=A0A0A2JHJ1_PENEN|nr:Aminoacyl-tRNA synthetase, class 1a, anticodon-binding [Penicillium expansum]KGO54872.1 Aminoacyl-tRNA synthetase, class 1a, anticodon-binding [Penicillium expansum]